MNFILRHISVSDIGQYEYTDFEPLALCSDSLITNVEIDRWNPKY